jgi:hypothetical protein
MEDYLDREFTRSTSAVSRAHRRQAKARERMEQAMDERELGNLWPSVETEFNGARLGPRRKRAAREETHGDYRESIGR